MLFRSNKQKWVVGRVCYATDEIVGFSYKINPNTPEEDMWLEGDSYKITNIGVKTKNPKTKEMELISLLAT